MKITPELIVFAMLAGPAALGAVGVVASKSAVRSALCLVFNFFLLAFLYFSLNMELLGISQIMVYAGAIMVLFVFVIMLLNPKLLEEKRDLKRPIGLLFGFVLFGLLASQILPATINVDAAPVANQVGSPQLIGDALFTSYVFPFEVVSILLLVGVVGSVFLAKKRTP
ncbi:MAG: NADH-quinone oxidoreductase subunit J [Armatimonadetes bacterium]|nr:NADH-quinone oxidoreductase subunit J [Armatimonadota bacterium]